MEWVSVTHDRLVRVLDGICGDGEYPYYDHEKLNNIPSYEPIVLGGLSIFTVDTIGGGDENTSYSIILSVTEDGKETFWKVPGWWSSYANVRIEVDQVHEVKPAEKVETSWN
jgi:hypothetical protein